MLVIDYFLFVFSDRNILEEPDSNLKHLLNIVFEHEELKFKVCFSFFENFVFSKKMIFCVCLKIWWLIQSLLLHFYFHLHFCLAYQKTFFSSSHNQQSQLLNIFLIFSYLLSFFFHTVFSFVDLIFVTDKMTLSWTVLQLVWY